MDLNQKVDVQIEALPVVSAVLDNTKKSHVEVVGIIEHDDKQAVNARELHAEINVEAFDKEFMTSLEIAELTGKLHKHVMRDIRNILKQGVSETNFGLMLNIKQLPNRGKREDPYYKLTKKGCLILASGYNAILREKIINRWEELETKEQQSQNNILNIPDFTNPAIAARAWADQFEKNQALTLENKQQKEELVKASQEIVELSATITKSKPKTTYFDIMMKNKSTSVITSTAQDYGMSAKAFNKLLFDLGIQHKVAGQWVLYRQYLDKGYVNSEPVSITHSDGTQTVKYISKWTQRGRYFLYEFLKSKDILPLIERKN